MFLVQYASGSFSTRTLLLIFTGILCLIFAGCSASTTSNSLTPTSLLTETPTSVPTPTVLPTPTSLATETPTSVPTSTVLPNCIPASPADSSSGVIAPQGWATFTDNIAHYTIKYPANWIVDPGACAGSEFDLYNYDPRQPTGGPQFPPGGLKFIWRPLPNPSQLSARDFFSMMQQQSLPESTCPLSAAQDVTVAGRAALSVTCPDVPGYDYYVPDGVMMLLLSQSIAQNGEPSPTFTQMVDSITFTTS